MQAHYRLPSGTNGGNKLSKIQYNKEELLPNDNRNTWPNGQINAFLAEVPSFT